MAVVPNHRCYSDVVKVEEEYEDSQGSYLNFETQTSPEGAYVRANIPRQESSNHGFTIQPYYQPNPLTFNRVLTARPPCYDVRVYGNTFPPSYFESERSKELESATQQGAEKYRRTRWTEEETNALVYAWREGFIDLESHKSPEAWKRITAEVGKIGNGKSVEQVKKKLSKLKDMYKKAKYNNDRNEAARCLPKFYDLFDEVLGTRSLVHMSGVRESGQGHNSGIFERRTEQNIDVDNEINTANEAPATAPQPKRTKRNRPSKSNCTKQLIDFLGEVQKQQQAMMKQFLDGIKEIEESSRRHTAETLLGVAKLFTNKRSKRRRDDSSDSDSD